MKLAGIGQLFLKGAAALLPIIMTLTVLWWLLISLERVLGQVLFWLVPGLPHITGLGLLLAIVLIFATGLLVQVYVARWLLELFGKLLNRIPLVGTVYNSIRDIVAFVSSAKGSNGLKKVVLVSFDNKKLIGFVTCADVIFENAKPLIAVYLPMSYQIGGYTLYLPESELEYIDMSVEEAMRTTLTAHMKSGG